MSFKGLCNIALVYSFTEDSEINHTYVYHNINGRDLKSGAIVRLSQQGHAGWYPLHFDSKNNLFQSLSKVINIYLYNNQYGGTYSSRI